MSLIGPSRQPALTQHFGRSRTKADIKQDLRTHTLKIESDAAARARDTQHHAVLTGGNIEHRIAMDDEAIQVTAFTCAANAEFA